MSETLVASASTTIQAPVGRVWEALTNPEIVKQWMFGTTIKTDWQKGSPVTYSGEWEGTPYEDRGTIEDISEGKFIKMKYWSAAFGEDVPENYLNVSYELEGDDEQTTVTITQDAKDETNRQHSEKNWHMVLDTLKNILEN